MSTPTALRAGTLRALTVLAAAALILPVTATAASAAPPALSVSSAVAIAGTLLGGAAGPIAAEAPDGTVYVASRAAGFQSVSSVTLTGVRHLVDRVTGVGAITTLAVDASYLYVGTPSAVTSYRRTNGALTERWPLSPSPRALSQLAVAGNRVWALLTPLGFARKPSSMVELDPTSPTRVRTVNGVADTTSIAATSAGIYYVTNRSSTLVRMTNAGTVSTAATHQVVNQTLSGPAAVQALVVVGATLIVRFDAGQGLDAVTYGYNATTLSGPAAGHGSFDSGALLGQTTALGLLESDIAGENSCSSPVHPCLARYGLSSGGSVGSALVLPYDEAGAPLGPYPAVVVATGSSVHVLRIS